MQLRSWQGGCCAAPPPPESLLLWSMTLLSLFGGILAAPGWLPLSSDHLGLLAALSLTGFAGQIAITEAFLHGQASAEAPFEYTALARGIGLDYLLWHVLPGGYTLTLATVIILAGLYLLRHERIHRQPEVHTSADHP